MKIDLRGKQAFITGSSRGIGYGVADVLASCGADVILLARREEELKNASRKIKEMHGVSAEYIVADLSFREELLKVGKRIEGYDINIFFFSTGGPKPGYFMEMDMKDWEDAVSLLLYPAIYLTKRILPHMINEHYGRIIYSTSVAIKEPIPNIALSNVVRISMAGLVKTLAKEVGRHGITVNGIMPGIIKTERMIKLAEDRGKREGKSLEDAINDYIAPVPVHRMGKPEEIGYAAAFLASDYASYINGAMLPVDGGRLSSVF